MLQTAAGHDAMSLLGYDQVVESLIPGYTSLARLSVSLLATSPLAIRNGASVLVAGCGSGAELLAAKTLRPDWTLTALDPSGSMLAIAQRKLQVLTESRESSVEGAIPSPPIHWLQGTVEDLPETLLFDGAMAVLVLQGLPDNGAKLRFLSSLSRGLRPGAQVVLVDQTQPERNGLEGQLIAARQMFQRVDQTATTEATTLEGLDPVYPIGLARLTGLLEATGFSDPIPVFRALDYEGFLLQRLS
ncbi:MAG: class I SAM-dependent methyltransferase [Cyanobacteriota bacterium]